MAGAMRVRYCLAPPVSPMAPALSGVSAPPASPGFSTTSATAAGACLSDMFVSPQLESPMAGALPKCSPSGNIRHFYSRLGVVSMRTFAAQAPTILPGVFEVHERRRRPQSVADMVATLARQFLADGELGSRLPTVRALAREHRSSNSSVHAAIGRLEQGGAIAIETRGRAGAFLVERSIDRLWAMVRTGPLGIALPLAASPRYEALATAFKQLLSHARLEVILTFTRGSRQRLQAVRDG